MDRSQVVCKACSTAGTGKYCSNCGQSLHLKKITVSNLLHEAFHFFTHLDKGFGFTVKELFRKPGKMQLEYLQGNRKIHQKPFSFFFIIATFTGLSLYWINIILARFFDAGNMAESAFFHQYMIFLLVFSVPYFAFITWILFRNSGYNFAEIGVLLLYAMGIILIIVIFSNTLKFIFHSFQTRYVEVPLVLLYTTITNVNFFKGQTRWLVILKTIVSTGIFFASVALSQDWFVRHYINV